MSRRTVVLLFVIGSSVGIPMAALYITFSPSHDRYFHAFVMMAACSVSFPAVTIFLNITLKMWDKAIEQSKILSELRDEIKPLVADAKVVIKSVEDMVNQFGDQPRVVVDFIDKLAKDGTVEKLTSSIEAVVKKVQDVIEHGGKPATGKSRDEILKEMEGDADAGKKADL